MVINPSAEPTSSNGEYSFDQNMVRLGIGAATVGLLLFGSLGVVAGMQEGFSSKGPIISAFACLALLGAAIHISRLSGRTLGITDDRILIKDKHGDQVCALHWVELARVTERRRMAQLALWDKPGTRRVLVDQQYEKFQKFPLIRARILAEYAKVFALKPLPIEFQNPSSMLLETLLFGVFGVFCAFGTWSTLRQGQFGLSVCLLSFAAVCFAYLLNLYPRKNSWSLWVVRRRTCSS